MEQEATISEFPSSVLRTLAKAMNLLDRDIKVTLPLKSTWKMVLRATLEALGERDNPIMMNRCQLQNRSRTLRESALDVLMGRARAPGLPIRTTYDIETLPIPERASENARKLLESELLKEDELPPSIFDLDPYLFTLKPSITQGTIPLVKANVVFTAFGVPAGDWEEKLYMTDMIWDTGAHQTIVCEELLSESFRQYLKDTMHDQYRSENRPRVLMHATIGFSNSPVELSAAVMVVAKSDMPNQWGGILFGQNQCIDRMSYHSISRSILQAKGETVDKAVWGDLVLDQYVDIDGQLFSF